jgi:uncharacterized membrane protein required for colicin V production
MSPEILVLAIIGGVVGYILGAFLTFHYYEDKIAENIYDDNAVPCCMGWPVFWACRIPYVLVRGLFRTARDVREEIAFKKSRRR